MASVDCKELKGEPNVEELEEGYLYPDLYETVDELG